MKDETFEDPEREYQGITDDIMLDEQLQIAVRALHVIAVMGTMNAKQVSEIAMDALREMETYGFIYEYFDK
tara:strand:- start:3077 stop:3289 length:213 start_codon:yes stop_codon:yes gene_type:complete